MSKFDQWLRFRSLETTPCSRLMPSVKLGLKTWVFTVNTMLSLFFYMEGVSVLVFTLTKKVVLHGVVGYTKANQLIKQGVSSLNHQYKLYQTMVSERKKLTSKKSCSFSAPISMGRTKTKALIDISSSVQGPSINNKGDMFTTPVEHVHKEPVREIVKRLKSNMQIMMQSLANLENIVATQSPMGRSQSHADFRVTQENIGVQTNRISTSPFQVTKKKNNHKRDKKTQKDSDNKKLKWKLFTVTIGKKDCPLRAVLEPLHGTKYDGLNKYIAIPQVYQILILSSIVR
ncbi:hypothetical protein Fmac_008946 [Flemingia macrophylla]|uniref:Uncharacterized protein n=1 Tax=Flemingia macrophylla TaxID=520843 RepID=A0ABD1MYU0_9FABA